MFSESERQNQSGINKCLQIVPTRCEPAIKSEVVSNLSCYTWHHMTPGITCELYTVPNLSPEPQVLSTPSMSVPGGDVEAKVCVSQDFGAGSCLSSLSRFCPSCWCGSLVSHPMTWRHTWTISPGQIMSAALLQITSPRLGYCVSVFIVLGHCVSVMYCETNVLWEWLNIHCVLFTLKETATYSDIQIQATPTCSLAFCFQTTYYVCYNAWCQ